MRDVSEAAHQDPHRDPSGVGFGQLGWWFLVLLIATLVSLLPQAWRQRSSFQLPLVVGTLISAVFQSMACGLLIIGQLVYDPIWVGAAPVHAGGYNAWLLLASAYFLMEAGVRILSALGAGEALGTLPLWLLERTPHWIRYGIRRLRGVRSAEPDGQGTEQVKDAPLPRARVLRRRRR